MTETFAPPDYAAVESDLPGIEVYAPVPIPTGDHREVVPFKCPRCSATTAYSIPDGSLVCAHCGYRQSFTQEAIGSRAEDFEFTVEVVQRAGRGWNVERKELVCQNCGAHTVVPADALASTCPFCASNRVIQRQALQDVLRPRFLVPFKLAEEDVRSIAREWLGSSWMTPRELRRAAVNAQFNAIYLPAWTFSAGTRGEWTAEVGYEKKDRRGNRQLVWQRKSGSVRLEFDETQGRWQSDQLTETRVRWEPRLGRLQRRYDNVSAPAIEEDGALSRAIGDFDLQTAVPFDSGMLEGALVRLPNRSVEDVWPDALPRFQALAADECRRASRADHMREFTWNPHFEQQQWTQLLLPVYTTFYQDDAGIEHPILVHGQTGQVAGRRQASMRSARRLSILLGLAAVALFAASMLLMMLSALQSVQDTSSGGAFWATLGMLGVWAAMGLGILAMAPVIYVWLFNRRDSKDGWTSFD